MDKYKNAIELQVFVDQFEYIGSYDLAILPYFIRTNYTLNSYFDINILLKPCHVSGLLNEDILPDRDYSLLGGIQVYTIDFT